VKPPEATAHVAVDAGSLVTKVASGRASAVTEPRFRVEATAPAGPEESLPAALAEAARAGPCGELWLAVPDTWLDGSESGGRQQETCRRLVEDELRLTGLARWVGQLAAVAVLAASQRGFTRDGRYLVCDVGGRGVRVGVCEVAGRTVREVAVRDAPGGGWADFDAAVRAALAAGSDEGLAGWYRPAIAQERRARTVLAQAKDNPGFRDALAYRLTGDHGEYELSAGQAADCFAATADRIRAGVAAVLGGSSPPSPEAAVLTGGLAWFPEAAAIVTEAAGVPPDILGPEAASHGALLMAAGQASQAWPGLPSVTVPMHQIWDGRLADASVALPWMAQSATADPGPLILDGPELTLDVAGRLMVARLPGLVPGPHRIGVRPAWRGSGLLVVRPGEAAGRSDVHVIPLDALETA
jgi:hypothetical protein